MNHFDPTVSTATRQALQTLAAYVADQELDCFPHTEAIGSGTVSPIYGIDPGGFIPFQRGGYEAACLIRCDGDPSYHIAGSGMTEHVEKQQRTALHIWLKEEGIADCQTDEQAQAAYEALTDEQREAYWEYEQSWLEPALLRFECWVEDDNRDRHAEPIETPTRVLLQLSVNYSDAPYYRSKHDALLYQLSLREGEVLGADPADLWKRLLSTPLGGGEEA